MFLLPLFADVVCTTSAEDKEADYREDSKKFLYVEIDSKAFYECAVMKCKLVTGAPGSDVHELPENSGDAVWGLIQESKASYKKFFVLEDSNTGYSVSFSKKQTLYCSRGVMLSDRY